MRERERRVGESVYNLCACHSRSEIVAARWAAGSEACRKLTCSTQPSCSTHLYLFMEFGPAFQL